MLQYRRVFALAVLPNGDLVAGGEFSGPGNSIARWNGQAWFTLGEGIEQNGYGVVHALAVLPSGELAVGGQFTRAGGIVADHIARWNGTSWSTFGAGLLRQGSSGVYALTVLPNGDLVAGGRFTTAGSNPAQSIARWNAGSGIWSGMSFGALEFVWSLAALPNGDLVAGGSFTWINGLVLNRIARWNGTSWMALGSGVERSNISTYNVAGTFALAVLPNGDLIAGGNFSTAGGVGASSISRWDGTSWSSLGSGPNAMINTLAVLRNGHVIAGGAFTSIGEVTANGLATWDGTRWSPFGSGIEGTDASIEALAILSNGDLIACGSFNMIDGVAANSIARWNGSSWTAMGSGLNSTVYAIAELPNGDLVAGGSFTASGSTIVNRVARWNGASWTALGTGFEGTGARSPTVNSLIVLPSGDLVAGGYLSFFGDGAFTQGISSWNGTMWSPLGSGVTGGVHSLAVLPNGQLVAGGLFRTAAGVPVNLARWDGTSWAPLIFAFNEFVLALAVLPNGDLLAGGQFSVVGSTPMNRIVRWDGASWAALGSGISGLDSRFNYPHANVRALALLPNHQLAVGGLFGTAGGSVSACFARYTFGNSCPADVDCDGGITTDDLLDYINYYANGIERADLDDGSATGTPDGGVTIDDLLYFLLRYEQGC